jgi:hypothetical protein
MSKLGCVCGHTIRDQTDFLPYKARILADEDTEKPTEILSTALVDCLDAQREGRLRAFLIDFMVRYDGDTPETATSWVDHIVHLDNLRDVFEHMLVPFWHNYDRTIYECERCGRLWVELPNGKFVSYTPETDVRGVLTSSQHHPPYPGSDPV